MFSLYWLKYFFGIAKKISIVIIVLLAVISFFLNSISKERPKFVQSPQNIIQKNRETIYKIINDQKLNNTKEGKLSINISRAITCGAIGEACTNNPDDVNKNYNHSVFGFLGNLIIMPFVNPPASGIYWVYSGLQNSGFVPKAYAAEGIGFGAIRPFSNLWKIFRDVSYLLLVVVLVVIGFMIMFRMKLNPQTVITVENALPRIVIALLLITFSFAIAGFLIDLMYVMIALSISLISNNNTYYSVAEFHNKYLNASFGDLAGGFFPTKGPSTGLLTGIGFLFGMGNSLLTILGWIPETLIRGAGAVITFILGFSHVWFVEGPLIKTGNGAWGDWPGTLLWFIFGIIWMILVTGFGAFILPELILAIILLVTIVFLIVRIFTLLLRAYLQVILFIIFAPIILLFEAIPGKSVFSWWFKNLISELMTFPIVVIFFLLGYVIVNTLSAPTSSGGNSMWTPPFLYGMDPNAFSVILGMGLMFLIPDFVKIIKELLGIKGLPISFGPGTFLGGGSALGGGALGLLSQFGSLSLAAGAIGRMASGARQKEGGGLRGAVGALFDQNMAKGVGGTTNSPQGATQA